MKFLQAFHSNKYGLSKGGFTLVELLVAMAVMSIILLMLGGIVQLVDQAWMNGQRNANNFTKARGMLDLIASDLQSGLFRSDLAAFPNSNIEFYTEHPGYVAGGGTVRNVSLVIYSFSADTSTSANMSTLQRGDVALALDPASGGGNTSTISFGDTTDFNGNTPVLRDTVSGIVDYKINFIYADGTASTTYTPPTVGTVSNPLRAVGITLAVVDNLTLNQLSTGQIKDLRNNLEGKVVSGDASVKNDWEAYLGNSGGMNWAAYPKSMGVGLKVFERYVTISGF